MLVSALFFKIFSLELHTLWTVTSGSPLSHACSDQSALDGVDDVGIFLDEEWNPRQEGTEG